jgi:hypothetical protein
MGVAMSALPRDDATNVGIEDDRDEQDDPEEHSEQRALNDGEEETLLDHAEIIAPSAAPSTVP